MGYGSLPLEQQLAMVQAEQGNVGAFGEIGRKWQAARTALETAEGQLAEHANRISGAWQDDAGKSFVRRTTDGTTSLRTHAQRIAAAAPWTALDAAAQAVPMVAQFVAQCLEQARQIQAAAAQASGAPTDSQVKQLQEAAGAKMDELGRLYVAAAQRLRAAAGESGGGATGGGAASSGAASSGAAADAGGTSGGASGGADGGASGAAGAAAGAAAAGGAAGGADAAAGAGPQAAGGADPGAVPAPEAPDLPSPVAPTLAGLESVTPPMPPSVTPVAPSLPSAAPVPGTALGGLAGLAGSVRLPGASAIPQVAVPRATTVTPATAVAPEEPIVQAPASGTSARPASGGFPGMMPPMSGALAGSGQRPGPGRAEHPFTGRGPLRRRTPGVPERLGGRAREDRRPAPAEEPRWSPDTPRLDDELWDVAPLPSPLRSDHG